MSKHFRLTPPLVCLWALLGATAQAQYFGQNQVQYDRFKWQVLETDHFLIHFYPDEREGVMHAAMMAERWMSS